MEDPSLGDLWADRALEQFPPGHPLHSEMQDFAEELRELGRVEQTFDWPPVKPQANKEALKAYEAALENFACDEHQDPASLIAAIQNLPGQVG